MPRQRYWKLEPSEVAGLSYPEGRVANWDIKLAVGDESAASFVGVFMYRRGAPLDYESVKGVAFYHNNLAGGEPERVASILRGRLGGKPREKGPRTFLEGSREVYSGPEIAALAEEMEGALGARAVITIEFEDMTDGEREASGLPGSKLLPIPGK